MTREEYITALKENRVEFIPLNPYDEKWNDFSTMKLLTCKNHPTAMYITKNPWERNLHILHYPDNCPTGECACKFSELVEIKINPTNPN